MSIIPFAQENFGYSSGNPVAPGNSENDAGVDLGKEFAQVGNATFKLGDAMDLANKKLKNEKSRLDSQNIDNQIEASVRDRIQQAEKAATIPEDTDGTQAVNTFRTNVQEDMDAILENSGADPMVKYRAKVMGDKKINTEAAGVGVAELKKKDDFNKNLFNKLVGTGISALYDSSNPIADFPIAADKLSKLILETDQLSALDKQLREPKARRELLEHGIQVMLDRGAATGNPKESRVQFAGAKLLLQRYGPAEIGDVEEMRKLDDHISTAEIKSNALGESNYQKQKRTDEQAQKDVADGYIKDIITLRYQAGNDSIKQAIVTEKITKLIEIGAVDGREARAQALLNPQPFSAQKDAKFEAKLMAKLFKDGNFDAAMTAATTSPHEVSDPKSAQLAERIMQLKTRHMNDPQFMKLVADGEKIILAESEPDPINHPERKFQKPITDSMKAQALAEFHLGMNKVPLNGIEGYARKVAQNKFGSYISTGSGVPEFGATDTLETLQKKLDSTKQQYLDYRKQPGGTTPDQRKQFMMKINDYQKHIEYMKSRPKSEVPAATPSPTGTQKIQHAAPVRK